MTTETLSRLALETWTAPLRGADDVQRVGGKAAGLARMIGLGLPVPPGFVITRDALDACMEDNGLAVHAERVTRALGAGDRAATLSAGAAMRARVLAATIPDHMRAAIRALRRAVVPEWPVIVRSSAVGEDGHASSFAGQLDSVADVTGEAALDEALRQCWASYWSERVLAYQLARGRRLDGMAVVVQRQVVARVSGVLFTRATDPSHAGPDEMLGEYCLGHGEALVSGRVDPGRFVVSRATLRWRSLARPAQAGADGADAALEGRRVAELARAGLALEAPAGRPQDIEWAIDRRGRLFLVQARPITAPVGAPAVTWSNANVSENFPAPISPLLYSIARAGYAHYFAGLARAFGLARDRREAIEQPLRHIIGVHGGRMYYNLTSIHAVLRAGPFGDHLARLFDQFVGAPTGGTAATGGARVPHRGRLRTCAEAATMLARAAARFARLSRHVEEFESTVTAFAERTHPRALRQRELVGLRDDLRAFMDIRCRRWTNAALADAAAMLSSGLLTALLRRTFPDHGDAAMTTLLRGLRDLVSGRPAIELWELSRRVRANAELTALFAGCPAPLLLERLAETPGGRWLRCELDAYLARWGHRRSGELMLTVPDLEEAPVPLLEILGTYVSLDGMSPAAIVERQERERAAATAGVLETLRSRRLIPGLPLPSQAHALRVLLRWTSRAIALRERARLQQALLYTRCRHIALAIGERLVCDGVLVTREDVFFLTVDELDDLLSGHAMFPDVGDVAGVRRHAHARLAAMRAPDLIRLPEGRYLSADAAAGAGEPATEDGSALTGSAACAGRVSGPAAVLDGLSDAARLRAGDVLVTRQTDPGWGTVFPLISGLVIEHGGLLSHGAILAREYGIPCVVGVKDATRRIPHGSTVTVDGHQGIVHVVG